MERDNEFSEIVRQNHASIYRICKAYLYDQSHVDDLYQEILLQVWASLNKYKGASKISTWIYRIAVNTAISYNLQHKKTRVEELPDAIDIPDEHTNAAKEKESQFSQLSYAISRLDEHDRLLISLVLEDLSYKEIAEILGSSTNNIGVRITRVKARLLKLIEDKISEDGL